MKLLADALEVLKGDFFKNISDAIDPWITTKTEKQEIQLRVNEAAHKFEVELQELALKQDAEFNQRIKDMEGTAKDLNQSGFFGKVIIFLRGAQRPIWGYLVIVLDALVYSDTWILTEGSVKEKTFLAINFLVLGFLFGERAVKNIMPIIRQKN